MKDNSFYLRCQVKMWLWVRLLRLADAVAETKVRSHRMVSPNVCGSLVEKLSRQSRSYDSHPLFSVFIYGEGSCAWARSGNRFSPCHINTEGWFNRCTDSIGIELLPRSLRGVQHSAHIFKTEPPMPFLQCSLDCEWHSQRQADRVNIRHASLCCPPLPLANLKLRTWKKEIKQGPPSWIHCEP